MKNNNKQSLTRFKGLFWRKDSRYIWANIGSKCVSMKTTDPLIARDRREYMLAQAGSGVQSISVDAFFLEFKRWYKSRVVDRTFLSETGRINQFLKYARPQLLHDITYRKIDDFLIHKAETVSASTLKHYRISLNVFLGYAVKRGYMQSNPVQKVPVPKVETRRRFYFSREQIDVMLANANKELKTFLMVALYTGMRFSELLDLQFKAIDFDRRVLYIDKEKSKRYRTIPMHKKLVSYLKKLPYSSGYVIRRKDGKRYKEGMKTAFRALIRRINEDEALPDIAIPKGTMFHALRHSCASWLVMSGVDIYTVMHILGHSSVTTTQIYSHVNTDHLLDAIDKFDFKKRSKKRSA